MGVKNQFASLILLSSFIAAPLAFGTETMISSYTKERIASTAVSELDKMILLNSFDLDNQDSEKNKLIIQLLKDSGEGLKAKIAEFYFSNKTAEEIEKEFGKLSMEDTANLSVEAPAFRHIHNWFMDLAVGYTIISLDNLFVEKSSLPTPGAQPGLGGFYVGGGFGTYMMALNNSGVSSGVAKLQELAGKENKSRYFEIEKRWSVNEILRSSKSIIKSANTSYPGLKEARISGNYVTKASNCDRSTYKVNNVDTYDQQWTATCKFDYGTTGKAVAGVYVQSNKTEAMATNGWGFSFPVNGGQPASQPPVEKREAFVFPQMESLSYFYESINLTLYGVAETKGGYSCKKYGPVKKDCRDYTSNASVSVSSKIVIPKCEDFYSCMPVMNVGGMMPGTGFSASMGAEKQEVVLLDKDREVKLDLSISSSHTGASGSNKVESQNSFGVYPPMFAIQHQHDFIVKTVMAINYIKDDISFLNIVADVAKRAKERTKRHPLLQVEEETLLYSILRMINNPGYKHNEESKIAFRIIENSVKNRLVELRYSNLSNEVQTAVDSYQSRLSYFQRASSLLESFLVRDQISAQDVEILRGIVEDLTGESIGVVGLDDGEHIKDLVASVIHTEKNNLYVERLEIEKKINELKLYGEGTEYEEALH